MKLTLKTTGFSLTPATEEYITTKVVRTVERLTSRMDPESVRLSIEVAKTTRHHNKGSVWRAEATLRVMGKRLRAETHGESMQEVVDLLEESIGTEIKGAKGKETAIQKRQARALKVKTRFSKAARMPKQRRVREEGM